MDRSFDFILAGIALIVGIMLLTGHGDIFLKGGNTKLRKEKYDEKKMEKVSGICLILIGVATGVDAFTTSVAAKIAYVVILFVILAVFLFVLRTKCIKK
jgi:putative Mn2+ efflux pump MntP